MTRIYLDTPIWIAATAAHAGAAVLTFDEHFRQIDRVGACVL